jgi:hypothetical protein
MSSCFVGCTTKQRFYKIPDIKTSFCRVADKLLSDGKPDL